MEGASDFRKCFTGDNIGAMTGLQYLLQMKGTKFFESN